MVDAKNMWGIAEASPVTAYGVVHSDLGLGTLPEDVA